MTGTLLQASPQVTKYSTGRNPQEEANKLSVCDCSLRNWIRRESNPGQSVLGILVSVVTVTIITADSELQDAQCHLVTVTTGKILRLSHNVHVQ